MLLPCPPGHSLCRRWCREREPNKTRRGPAGGAMPCFAPEQHSCSSFGNHRQSRAGRIQTLPPQPLKYSHSAAGCQRSVLRRAHVDVADQLLASQNHQPTIQIQKRKSNTGHKLRPIPGRTQKAFNFPAVPVFSMSDIRIKSRHRTSWRSQYQPTTFVHVRSRVLQEKSGVVQVFDDFRTDRVSAPASLFLRRGGAVQQITLNEARTRHLAAGGFHTPLRQLQIKGFCTRGPSSNRPRHIAPPPSDIDDSRIFSRPPAVAQGINYF